MKHPKQPHFLPISLEELRALGIDQPDIIMVSGDAYVDHPSFAAALLGRVLWDAGFSVAIIPQPDPKNPESFCVLGEPRLFFAISGGSVDSMVSNYTAARKKRSDDAYSPGGIPRRPDRAV
ncbi:MAG: YgiQ family radical SAM protein, partial [Methanospirillum sp.]|nr:YgiQ family radical SAM protein [Methanospirillum sp.]